MPSRRHEGGRQLRGRDRPRPQLRRGAGRPAHRDPADRLRARRRHARRPRRRRASASNTASSTTRRRAFRSRSSRAHPAHRRPALRHGPVRILLPVWAQKDFGPWSLFGGGGYTINPGAGNRNFWQSGLALTRNVTPRLSLGAEITHQRRRRGRGPQHHRARRRRHLPARRPVLAAVFGGARLRHHRGGAQVNAYAALALNF